jgi:UDP-N-acetylglucosamine diphosphorylase / glucose-1-phosphate thymidylyltransferase / UDP-N-acetylgalactosamine diphosphorylase / glucosamine-1-phosphate N-acetyltransferase / galactosamine-1-phosphate N-acetyltransferase
MKAVVLAGGRGVRLGGITRFRNKCMINYQGSPIVEHIVARMAGLPRIDEVILVVGYEAAAIVRHLGRHYRGTPITYHEQPVQHGLIHALQCAAPSVKGVPFLLLLGDEVTVEPRFDEFLDESTRYDALLGAVPGQPEELIRRTYTLLCGADRLVHRLIEKPVIALNDLMGTGIVALPPDTFELIERTPVNPVRAERDLPSLLQTMVDEGRRVGWFPVCTTYANINDEDDLRRVDDDPQFRAAPAVRAVLP